MLGHSNCSASGQNCVLQFCASWAPKLKALVYQMKLIPMFSCFVFGILVSSCAEPGKVTGGGSILDPATDAKIATLGFNADSCDGLAYPKGHFNFVSADHQVKFNGGVVAAAFCAPEGPKGNVPCFLCEVGQYQIEVNYRSTNTATPGTGRAFACVADSGSPDHSSSDFGRVSVIDGPYVGYQVVGPVRGNVTSHTCH